MTSPHLIDHADALDAILPEMEGFVALDTEFHAERRYHPELMLVQLATQRGQVYLIDPMPMDLSPLGQALNACDLIVHGGQMDIPILRRAMGLSPRRILDTQVLAGFCGKRYPMRLDRLIQEVLGVSLPPGQPLSDWSTRPLSAEQLEYAAADVSHLHALVAALVMQLDDDRIEGVWELSREALLDKPQVAAEQVWKGIPSARGMSGVERTLLKALAAWREGEASSANLPPHQILPDRTLIDLVKAQPTSMEALRANRTANQGQLKKHGPVLLTIIAAGLKVPEERHPPAVQTSPEATALMALLNAWAHGRAQREGMAVELVLPEWRQRELAESWSQGGEAAPGRWRTQRWGQALLALREGRLALALGAHGVSEVEVG